MAFKDKNGVEIANTAAMAILLAAAGKKDKTVDEFTTILPGSGVNKSAMAERLTEALSEREFNAQQAAEENAVSVILSVLDQANNLIAKEVAKIREARVIENASKAFLSKMTRANQYGEETGNYLPLMALVTTGGTNAYRAQPKESDINVVDMAVPDNWAPKGTAVKKKAAFKKA